MLWAFVEACLGGRLPFGECSPVYSLGVILTMLLVALAALAVMISRRTRRSPGRRSASTR